LASFSGDHYVFFGDLTGQDFRQATVKSTLALCVYDFTYSAPNVSRTPKNVCIDKLPTKLFSHCLGENTFACT
jgi:hypothetical protein